MISFILIGKNVERTLVRSLNSIYDTITKNQISTYEVIYVDSQSTDNSLEILTKYPDVKAFAITGACNAAIARNIGAIESNGTILYFIDADMEINSAFLQEILQKESSMKYDVVSGLVTDVVQGIKKSTRYLSNAKQSLCQETLDGGIFLIRREIWEQMGGMRTKFKKGQDGDLGFRMAARKIPFVRLQKEIALHHTTDYHHKSRLWKSVWDRSMFYSRCVLYRDHLLNFNIYCKLWREDKTLLMLLLMIIMGLLWPLTLLVLAPLYFMAIFFRSLKQERQTSLFMFCVYYILVDVLNILYFFTFYPKEKKVNYVAIQNPSQKELVGKYSSPDHLD